MEEKIAEMEEGVAGVEEGAAEMEEGATELSIQRSWCDLHLKGRKKVLWVFFFALKDFEKH